MKDRATAMKMNTATKTNAATKNEYCDKNECCNEDEHCNKYMRYKIGAGTTAEARNTDFCYF